MVDFTQNARRVYPPEKHVIEKIIHQTIFTSMEFKDILDSLLSGYEQGGSQDVDSFLKEKGQELGLSEENMRKVEEASAFIDRLAAENESLQEAKKTGQNLKGWMMDKLEQSLQVVEPGEKKEQLVKALSEKMENIVNNQIKSME